MTKDDPSCAPSSVQPAVTPSPRSGRSTVARQTRLEREAAALRANLRRRKEQARGQASQNTVEKSEDGASSS